MITNDYSSGCVVYFTNMSQPVYVRRDNYESVSTMNFTDITNNGYYNIYVMSLPSPAHCLDISIEPGEWILSNI